MLSYKIRPLGQKKIKSYTNEICRKIKQMCLTEVTFNIKVSLNKNQHFGGEDIQLTAQCMLTAVGGDICSPHVILAAK